MSTAEQVWRTRPLYDIEKVTVVKKFSVDGEEFCFAGLARARIIGGEDAFQGNVIFDRSQEDLACATRALARFSDADLERMQLPA